MIPGVLPRASLFCFVFVFSLSFESVSAMEPVTPTVMNETAVFFHAFVLASALCQLCQKVEWNDSAFHLFFCAFKSLR